MTMTSRGKAAVRIIRSSRIGRLAADEVLIALSGPLGTNPSSSDLLCRFSIYDMAHGAERLGTVSALTTLFFELVECLDIERFIEAGAKDGAASIRAAALPSIAEVVAFEANPYTHERFHEQLRQHGVRHEHMALSDREGAVEFLVRLNSDGRPIADGQASLLERFNYAPGHTRVAVDAVTLDGYFGAPSGMRTAIWMDVEGATSMVVRGGLKVLAETQVAIIEVEERASWEGQEWLRADVVREMRRLGLIPVARDRQSRYQYNIVFVREGVRRDPSVKGALRTWRGHIRSMGRCTGDQ